jgi:hypothetical protein
LASRITNHATSLSSQEKQWMECSISVWPKLMTANFPSPPSLTSNRKINLRDNQLSKWAQLHQICPLWNTPIILKAKETNFSLLKIFKLSGLIRNHKIWIRTRRKTFLSMKKQISIRQVICPLLGKKVILHSILISVALCPRLKLNLSILLKSTQTQFGSQIFLRIYRILTLKKPNRSTTKWEVLKIKFSTRINF